MTSINRREYNGIKLVKRGLVKIEDGKFKVTSSDGTKQYDVQWCRGKWLCTCEDYAKWRKKCKHIYAVIYYHMLQDATFNLKTEAEKCPFCGSVKVVKRGLRYLKHGISQRLGCRSCGRRFTQNTTPHPHHKAYIVMLTLDLFFRGLSLRQISEHIFSAYQQKVCPSTILNWLRGYSQIAEDYVASTAGKMRSEAWSADETVVKLNGKKLYLWALLDQESRFILALRISTRRSNKEATKLFREGLNISTAPYEVITDGASFYGKAIKKSSDRGK